MKRKGASRYRGTARRPIPAFCVGEKTRSTSDTCGRLASMPKWGAGDGGGAGQRDAVYFTRRNSEVAEASSVGTCACGGAATLPLRLEPARGGPHGAAQSAAHTLEDSERPTARTGRPEVTSVVAQQRATAQPFPGAGKLPSRARLSIGRDPICRTAHLDAPGARSGRRRRGARPSAAGRAAPRRIALASCARSCSA